MLLFQLFIYLGKWSSKALQLNLLLFPLHKACSLRPRARRCKLLLIKETALAVVYFLLSTSWCFPSPASMAWELNFFTFSALRWNMLCLKHTLSIFLCTCPMERKNWKQTDRHTWHVLGLHGNELVPYWLCWQNRRPPNAGAAWSWLPIGMDPQYCCKLGKQRASLRGDGWQLGSSSTCPLFSTSVTYKSWLFFP